MAAPTATPSPFVGDGELARLCREIDWSETSLGPVDTWPAATQTAVRMTLECPVPITLWCGSDLVLIYNDAFRPFLGAEHPRALGRRGSEVWSGIWPSISPMIHAIRMDGAPPPAENMRLALQLAIGGADEATFRLSLSPVRDEQGQIVAVLGIASEIRPSEDTDRAAVDSEQRFHFLTNAIPVQVWTATPEGALDYVSDRVGEYFGKTTAEVIGDQWRTVLHPDDLAPTIERWKASLETGEPYEVEFRLWSARHQAYRWHLGRAVPQRDAAGVIIHWFGTNTEIEDRKQAEAELRRLTAEATEADRAKAAFLAAMSHELRTPLNAIGGYAQLLEMGVRGPVSEEQRVDLLKIQRSKDHLDALVSDVLNFAKLGSGRVEYHVAPVDVHATLQGVLEMVAPQLAAKELRVTPFVTPRQLSVSADSDKVRQILINLFGNALKFTPPNGSITLDIKATRNDVAISVTDTGIGIAGDQLDHIFEPFAQAGKALDARDQGVGLGLAISRQLARAMRGDLKVASTLGQGSTFTLTLPRR